MVPSPSGEGTVALSVLSLFVVLSNLLRQGVVGPEALPEGRSRYAAYCVLFRAIQEFTPADLAVNVTVEYVE